MQLTIKPLDDAQRQNYESFIARAECKPHATFMQTWEWGEVQRQTAIDFVRLGLYDGKKLVAVGQFVLKKIHFGTFWYSPRGLVLNYSNKALVTAAYQEVAQYFKELRPKAAFLRVDPDIIRGDPVETWLDTLRPKQSAIFTQAERVWLIELQKSEEQLLEWMKAHGMRANLSYYLRKAPREGVTVRASDKDEDLETLISMLNDLHKRKGGIGKHNDEHYRRQFALLKEKGYEKVFLAEKDGIVLAAALVAIYGKEASYLHAASSDKERALSAPHTLQVEVMKYLQTHHPEVTYYNLWGIVSDKNRKPSHPRHGYSEFKRSFGGYKVEYIRSRDFVYNYPVWLADWLLNKYRTIRYKND